MPPLYPETASITPSSFSSDASTHQKQPPAKTTDAFAGISCSVLLVAAAPVMGVFTAGVIVAGIVLLLSCSQPENGREMSNTSSE